MRCVLILIQAVFAILFIFRPDHIPQFFGASDFLVADRVVFIVTGSDIESAQLLGFRAFCKLLS